MDRAAGERGHGRRGERSRSVDRQSRLRDLRPLWKYSWPERRAGLRLGEHRRGRAVHDDGSRLGAYLGADSALVLLHAAAEARAEWSRVVIWSSGIGTFAALLGIVVGVWMYSPSKRYRNAGAPTSIPYRGQKRWHTLFGLIFGLGAATWAFSGMLSMDPFPRADEPADGAERAREACSGAGSMPGALRGGAPFAAFAAKHPREALRAARGRRRSRNWSSRRLPASPVYLATLAGGDTHIVPVDGAPQTEFDAGADHRRRHEGGAAGAALAEIAHARSVRPRTI